MPLFPPRVDVLLYDSGEVAAATANFDVTNISGAYTDLVCYLVARGDTNATQTTANVTVNNDSSGNYDTQTEAGSGTTASASESLAGSSMSAISIPGATATASVFSAASIEIPSYSSTTFQKMFQFITHRKFGTSTGNLVTRVAAGWWRSTAAINRITVTPAAGNFAAGSRFRIYGRA